MSKVDGLRKLDQASAAWLLGTSARSLRDWADAPRNGDGSYDAAALVAWSRMRTPAQPLDDGDVERLLQAADCMLPENGVTALIVADLFQRVLDECGDAGAALVLKTIIDAWNAELAHERAAMTCSESELAEHVAHAIDRARAEYAAAELKRPVVCAGCRKQRRGKSWVSVKAIPRSAIEGLCPGCAGTLKGR